MLLPDPIGPDDSDHQDGDGEGRGARPDALLTPIAPLCPWCFNCAENVANVEGNHTCTTCGKEFTTRRTFALLYSNEPKGTCSAFRFN